MLRSLCLAIVNLTLLGPVFGQCELTEVIDALSGIRVDSVIVLHNPKPADWKTKCLLFKKGYQTLMVDGKQHSFYLVKEVPPFRDWGKDTSTVEIRVSWRQIYHGDIYVEYWDDKRSVPRDESQHGETRFRIKRSLFKTTEGKQRKLRVWISSPDELHYPLVKEIVFDRSIEATFERRSYSVSVKLDRFGSHVDGTVRFMNLRSNGARIPDKKIQNGQLEFLLVDVRSDNKYKIEFTSDALDSSVIRCTFKIKDTTINSQTFYIFPYNLREYSSETEKTEQRLRPIALTLKVRDIRRPFNGHLESSLLKYHGAALPAQEVRNGYFQAMIDRPSLADTSLSFYNHEMQIGSFKIDTTLTVYIHPDSTEKHIDIFFPYDLAQRYKDEQERLKKVAEEAEQKQREAEQLAKRTAAKQSKIDRRQARRSRTADRTETNLSVEYISRAPNTSTRESIARRADNFKSFPQVSTLLNFENVYIGPINHLAAEVALRTGNSFGVGVSVMPVLNLIDELDWGVNGYLGGTISSYGANIANRSNGSWGVFGGLKLGYMRTQSKFDPGKVIFDMRGSVRRIPFINSDNEHEVQTVRQLSVGGELAINRRFFIIPIGAFSFRYSVYNNTFDRDLAVGFKIPLEQGTPSQ